MPRRGQSQRRGVWTKEDQSILVVFCSFLEKKRVPTSVLLTLWGFKSGCVSHFVHYPCSTSYSEALGMGSEI